MPANSIERASRGGGGIKIGKGYYDSSKVRTPDSRYNQNNILFSHELRYGTTLDIKIKLSTRQGEALVSPLMYVVKYLTDQLIWWHRVVTRTGGGMPTTWWPVAFSSA
jgi:hypothetical protein